ncbi:MAG TPA: DUF4928 family protein [Tepidisphaeraceae bacterium]|nr:DUF4928 family protein [Tepidisphaeraceae bacterium]
MTSNPLPPWYVTFRSEASLQPANRGNVAAVLVVLRRLSEEAPLRAQLREIAARVQNPLWRGWAALSLVVTPGEGQIAEVTGEKVGDILLEFGIAVPYVGADGGRSSRGNFRPVRQLLGTLPADRIDSPDFREELHAAQEDLINTLVSPQLEDVFIEIDLSTGSSLQPESVIAEILRMAALRRAAGGVAQHLVGAKLARRFRPAEIENYSVFASDHQLDRDGDFVHGHVAFHVTVVARPSPKLRHRLSENRRKNVEATVLVPRDMVAAYQPLAMEHGARVRSIEEYVGDNLLEMGNHDRQRTIRELRDLIAAYNARVDAVERANCGLNLRVRGG